MSRATILMCRPEHYGINYEINPWMHREVQVDTALAMQQWEALVRILKEELDCEIVLIDPVEGLPDLVFTANAGYVRGNLFIPSRFRYPQRQGEEPHFRKWFQERGYEIADLPGTQNSTQYFEGCGDALPVGDTIYAGFRFRSDAPSLTSLSAILGQRVISLELAQKWFYHLDTCFCPLGNGDVLYYPGAFDEYGRKAIEGNIGEERIIRADETEAPTFCCNAVAIDDAVVINSGASKLARQLRDRGLRVFQTDLSEFIKSGGSAKCLTLRLK